MDNPEANSQSADSPTVVSAQENKRPWSVTLLAIIVLIITIINLIRLVLSIRYWTFLSSRPAVSPLYLALTGLAWSAAGAVLLWGLWRAKPWAPRLMQAIGLTYALYYWLDQIFLKDHPISGASGTVRALLPSNWQFSAILTVIGLVFMVWVLGRAKVKTYFSTINSVD